MRSRSIVEFLILHRQDGILLEENVKRRIGSLRYEKRKRNVYVSRENE